MLLPEVFMAALFIAVIAAVGSAMCRRRRRCKQLRVEAKRQALRRRAGL